MPASGNAAGSAPEPERATFRLVGTFAVVRDGRVLSDAEVGSRKARQLLKLLVVERGRTVPSERIVDLLWGVDPPRRPVDNVATLVSRLWAALADVVAGTRAGYALAAPAARDVDLDRRWSRRCATRWPAWRRAACASWPPTGPAARRPRA